MTGSATRDTGPAHLDYEADLLGNIQQALAGLQGFEVMALELIQNADDTGAQTLTFDVREASLVVRNDGRFSTCGLQSKRCPWETDSGPDGLSRPCNFHAISRMGSRSKVHASAQIGRFGIGFVSVYQVTDSPVVRSGDVEMRLDPLAGRAPTTAIAETAGTEFEFAWASSPSPTRQALNASPTPVDVVVRMLDAIADTMTRGLFFLRNLSEVKLLRNGLLHRSVTIERGESLVTLSVQPEGRTEAWKLVRADAAGLAGERSLYEDYPTLAQLERSTTVQVAVPLGDHLRTGLLYAYLPTEQPSGMPLHVNGDFFPHPNRRSIVLSGEQHERYWNELLLDTAAAAIADAFDELRDLLGGMRLWALGEAAFQVRETRGFGAFWRQFERAARASDSIWTAGGAWRRPASCHLAPEHASEAELDALTQIGLDLVHPDLRPHWTVLSAVGATPLKLAGVVERLEAADHGFAFSPENTVLPALWSVLASMIDAAKERPGYAELAGRLKAVAFMLDADGDSASPKDLWRPWHGVSARTIASYVADCPLVQDTILGHAGLTSLVDVYDFAALADDLKRLIPDVAAARSILGDDEASARAFYGFLTSFDVGPDANRAGAALADVPMLWTRGGHVSASRGQLPGGFVDPIGHFELIDTGQMDQRMLLLAKEVLGVRVLTFKDYVEDHLETILASGPDRLQYKALLGEVLGHRAELEAEGALQPLAQRSFVRTRAGGYARPDACYYWTAALEALLGEAGETWVDEAWMPEGGDAARVRDLLEHNLGMRSSVSTKTIVARLSQIVQTGSIDEIADRVTPLIRHVLERWARLLPSERQDLEGLRSVAFLPAALDGTRVQDKRYAPGRVYRVARLAGFASQVRVVDLGPLRQATSAVTEFLDLLAMPPEPPTADVVAHLEHCMAAGAPPSDVVYAMLSERVAATDADSIDRLAGSDFIFVPESARYISADRVFWIPPPFGAHWHAASPRMRLREALYRRLGVVDEPGPTHYAGLLTRIAGTATPTEEDFAVHALCLGWLANALDGGMPGAEAAVAGLVGASALLNLDGRPVPADEAIWIDSQWLVAPFGDALDGRLVAPPGVPRAAAERLFRRLAVTPATQAARLVLAATPENRCAPGATQRLQERSDLILWLAPNPKFRAGLREMLIHIEVRLTETLLVHSEIHEFDPPVRSQVVSAAAFYQSDEGLLHVRADAQGSMDWPAAFRALFSRLEGQSQGVEMPPVVMAAAFVASAASWEEAERALRQSDYGPPPDESAEYRRGDELGDARTDDGEDAETVSDEDEDEDDGRRSGSDPDERDGRTTARSGPSGSKDRGDDTPRPTGEGSRSPLGGSQKATGEVPFRSKPDDGAFGAPPGEGGGRTATSAASETGGSHDAGGLPSGERPGTPGPRLGEDTTERESRRSRMLAYVGASGRESDSGSRTNDGSDLYGRIDAAAIIAALKHEQARGWSPLEQPHNNPGYDIVSTPLQGTGRRLIEVKGLEGEWTERGIKLSHVQYGMAQAHPGEFWIYVVENARDLQRQKVTAIANPFSKVVEYWFDHQWRQVAEEAAGAAILSAHVGARVRHAMWGTGTIVAVDRRGIAPFLTVDFGPIEGRRGVTLNSSLAFVD